MAHSSSPHIGFLGAGKMATALAKGWLDAGLVRTDHVIASDPVAEARDAFAKATKATATADNREVVTRSDVLVMAVKPQTMKAVLGEVRALL